MHARGSLIGLIVTSVAVAAWAFPAFADDDVRRRAEALARDATAEFDKAMPATTERSTEASVRVQPGADRAGPLGPFVDWLGRAADVYTREIFPRIVAGRPEPDVETTTLAVAEDWLRRAGQTYQTVVVPGLTEAQPAPPAPKSMAGLVTETVSPTPRIDEAARQTELKRLAEVKADEARKAAARRAEEEARRVADASADAEKKKADEARAAARKAAEEKLEEARREQAARLAAEQKAQAEAAAKKSEQDKKAAEEKARIAADEKARFDAAKAAVEKKIADDAAREAEQKARAARPAPPIDQPMDGVAVEPRKRAGDAPPSPATMLGASVLPGPTPPTPTPPPAAPAPAPAAATPSKPAPPASRSGTRTAEAPKAKKSARSARVVRVAAAKPSRTLARHQPAPRRVAARVCPRDHKFRTKQSRRT
jgi:chemotaxis protein histidine kinase CheA